MFFSDLTALEYSGVCYIYDVGIMSFIAILEHFSAKPQSLSLRKD